MVLGIATPIVAGDRLFVSGFYVGSMMLQLTDDPPGVRELWFRKGSNERDTDALHSLISTPLIDGDHIYGIGSYGAMRCLDIETGNRVWEDTMTTADIRCR